jgi:hypothetical protein
MRLMSCRTEVARTYGPPVACPLLFAAYTRRATGLRLRTVWTYLEEGVIATALSLAAVAVRPVRSRSREVLDEPLGDRADVSGLASRTAGPHCSRAFVRWQMFARHALPG